MFSALRSRSRKRLQFRPRVNVRTKITLPYALLALVVAIAGATLVAQLITDNVEERFLRQLTNTGILTADRFVQEEMELLEALRGIAFTKGIAVALEEGDARTLRQLIEPQAFNFNVDAVDVLDLEGKSVLSLHRAREDSIAYTAASGVDLRDETVVESIWLAAADGRSESDAGLVTFMQDNESVEFFAVARPVVQEERFAGAVVVAITTRNLARRIKQDTLADTTFYTAAGEVSESTFFVQNPPQLSSIEIERALSTAYAPVRLLAFDRSANNYSEILGSWHTSNGDTLGIFGSALMRTSAIEISTTRRLQILLLATVAFLLVIWTGVSLANRITRPLLKVVDATSEVADGNLDIKVEPLGNDELAVLARSFNQMTDGLREGQIYRDLLGRSVSPPVREAMRRAFSSGQLQLAGQETTATILVSDIRGFTAIAEREAPATIITWLNSYLEELVPLIEAEQGVVDSFGGDSIMAFFGHLPMAMPPAVSAHAACRAALSMLHTIGVINAERVAHKQPPLITGIGIHTGDVIAGQLGTLERLHYTLIGDAVNTAHRIEAGTKMLGESAVLVSQNTVWALGEHAVDFNLEPLGPHSFRGKSEPLPIFRLHPDGKALHSSMNRRANELLDNTKTMPEDKEEKVHSLL